MCTLQVVATDTILYLKDRTIVHLFFKDLHETEFNTDLNTYKLAYMGEVRALQMSKKVGSRSAFLQCEDFSAYWDQCFQYTQDFSSGGDAFWDRTSSFMGANKGLFDNILRSPEVVIANLVNGRSVTRPDAEGLVAGVLKLFEGMGGVYRSTGSFRGMNDFFSAAELRCRITDQIGAADRDTTTAKMMDQSAFINWITNTMGSYGALLSYRDILKILFQFVFHESCPNPMAKYQPTSTRKKTTYEKIPISSLASSNATSTKYQRIVDEIRKFVQTESTTAKGIQVNRTGRRSSPPKTDEGAVILAYIQSLRKLRDQDIEGKLKEIAVYNSGMYGTINKTGTGLGLRPQSTRGLNKIRKEINQAIPHLYRAQQAAEKNDSTTMLSDLRKALAKMNSLSPIAYRRVARQRIVPTQDLLYTQLIYPNLYFAPPPRCNVIFPEHYIDFQFTRDFRKEITRMRLQLKYWLAGKGSTAPFRRGAVSTKFLGIYYYAPDVLGHKEKLYLSSTNNFSRVLLPHERFSGIIPSIQSLGRVNFYLARKDSEYQERGGGIPYVQRTANFKFFHDRYSSRQLNLVCIFLPHLVCGMPALVLDRYGKATMDAPYNRQETMVNPGKRPTQYLGRIMQLTHNLAQDNPTTMVTMSTVRTHDERVELIGAGEKDKLKKSKQDKKRVQKMQTIRSNTENLETELLLLKDDLVSGEFTHAQLKSRFRAKASQADYIRTLAETDRIAQAARVMARVQVAVLESERHLVSGRNLQAVAHINFAISMTSTIVNFVPAEIKLDPERVPAEEVLRPPWYAPLYDNKNIGREFYQPLLGCDSLVDTTAIKQEGVDTEHPILTANTVQFAVDQLVEIYGSIKRSGGNVTSFVQSYVKRPIATLAQIIGDQGFHRHSFGSVTGFEDLEADPLLGVENSFSTIRKLDPSMDVRAERREVVIRYMDELKDKALLG
jgi:hypothetical protein